MNSTSSRCNAMNQRDKSLHFFIIFPCGYEIDFCAWKRIKELATQWLIPKSSLYMRHILLLPVLTCYYNLLCCTWQKAVAVNYCLGSNRSGDCLCICTSLLWQLCNCTVSTRVRLNKGHSSDSVIMMLCDTDMFCASKKGGILGGGGCNPRVTALDSCLSGCRKALVNTGWAASLFF